MQVGPNRERLQVAETMGICTTAKFQCEMNEQSAEAKLTLSLGHKKMLQATSLSTVYRDNITTK